MKSGEDGLAAYEEYSTDVNEFLSKAVKNSTGDEQKVYVKMQEFRAINNEVILRWQNANDSILHPRILDYSVLNTPEEFDYQISVLEHYQKQSKLYKKNIASMIPRLDSFFQDIPSDNQTLIDVKKGAMEKYNLQKPIFNPLIDAHISYSKNLIEILELLEKNSGQWKYESDEISFENEQTEQKFWAILNEVANDEEQINDLSDKLIETVGI